MTERTAYRTRPDLTCRKTGEPIPLDDLSVMQWSDKLWLVYCPDCRVLHEFFPVAATEVKS